MANTLATPTWVTKEIARRFLNNLKFAATGNCNREYDDQYMQAGAKVGYTVNARLPQRWEVTKGQALVVQSITDQTLPISLTDQANIGLSYSTADQTMIIQDVRERYINPAADQLANTVDYDGLQRCYKDVYNTKGTLGTTPATNLIYLQTVAALANAGAPTNNLRGLLDPNAMVTLVNANAALFNNQPQISAQYKSGQFAGETLGIEKWFQDANYARHTTGTFTAATPLVNGANQTGSTININGWASSATTLKRGDTFMIANVFEVNQLSRASTGRLQTFVITADTSDVTGTTATLPISPPIITSGQLQTVNSVPASGAAVLVTGATAAVGGTLATTISPQELVYDPSAFVLVMADLMQPDAGAKSTTVRSKELGISIRMVTQYQIGTDQQPSRLDILYGWATLRPGFAYRIYS